MKGDILKSVITRGEDTTTGVTIIKLTDDTGDTYHPYFTQPLMDNEGKYMLAASNRTGKWQIYSLQFANGQMVQLTDEENIQPSLTCLDKKNHTAYYFNGRKLKSVRLDTLEEEEHLEVPEGFHAGILSITDDGRYLAFAYIEDIGLITQSARIYSGMREQLFRRPTSVIMRYDTVEKTNYAVWGERTWISHVNIHPADENTILFCHEGSWHLVQRMWIAKVKTDEVYPLVKQSYNMEKVGHEFFTASGRIGAQYSCRPDVNMDFKYALHGDVYVNADGSHQKIYYYPYGRSSHIQLNHAEDRAVGDAAHIRPDMQEARKCISLIKYEGNKANVGLLCTHNTSWKAQNTHPHPIFTPDDQYVIYSSDAGGKVNIYMARADWDKCLK